jgi:hypothetical protein
VRNAIVQVRSSIARSVSSPPLDPTISSSPASTTADSAPTVAMIHR